jgi:hypothetical protein
MGMLKDLDITPEDPAELKAVNRLLANEVKALSLKVEQLQHQLHGANRHRFGSKSEGLDQLARCLSLAIFAERQSAFMSGGDAFCGGRPGPLAFSAVLRR